MTEEAKKGHRTFKIIIDHLPFDWNDQYITGVQIKQLVGADMSYGVWLIVPGPEDDQPIDDNEQVDLSHPGRERFFTGPTQTTEG